MSVKCKVCGKETSVHHQGICIDCAFAGHTPEEQREPRSISKEWIDASAIPSETVEQERLFIWANLNTWKWPELESMYHITNEGKRSRITGARLKRMGLKKGVPDICLPAARCGCHALYIELKRIKDGRPTKDQLEWIDRLTRQGNMALVCSGWEQAADVIEKYLQERL